MDEHPSTEHKVDRNALGVGIALLVIGVALSLARLDLIDLEGAARFWPLLLMAAGAWQLVTGAKRRKRRRGAIVVLIGAWLLVSSLGLFGLGFHNSWPVLMILLGLLGLVWPKDAEDRAGSLVLFAVGSWLLSVTLHLWGLEWRTAWPLLLVVVGISIALGGLLKAVPAFLGRRS